MTRSSPSRRSVLAGIAASPAAAVALPPLQAEALPVLPATTEDPWVRLAREYAALHQAIDSSELADEPFQAFCQRCWQRTTAIEHEISRSTPSTAAGANAWLAILSRAGYGDVLQALHGGEDAEGFVAAIASAAMRFVGPSGQAASAELEKLAQAIGSKDTPEAAAETDHWLEMALRYTAGYRALEATAAEKGWGRAQLDMDSRDWEAWQNAIEAGDRLSEAEPQLSGLAAWLRLAQIRPQDNMWLMERDRFHTIIEHAVHAMCGMSMEAALAVGRVEADIAEIVLSRQRCAAART